MSENKADLLKGHDDDPTAVERKRDHIELAFRSQVDAALFDDRFLYEPLLAAHPKPGSLPTLDFLGKQLRAPMWVSSMTGGTTHARTINHNLARACRDFGMGMGLGSCRSLLYSDETLSDFAVRNMIGDQQPLFANLGIAQLEQLIAHGELWRVRRLLEILQADGLIIHVNPMQEWLQPEGDRFEQAPLVTIEHCLEAMPDVPFIVKEVGQGMGPESLKTLLQLPLAALDFAASGGTNFAMLELLRSDEQRQETYAPLAKIGHSAAQMADWTNEAVTSLGDNLRCRQIIASGGIKNFLDGYYLIQRLSLPAVYGQASGFLQYAKGHYDELYHFVDAQVRGLELAFAFLKLKD